MTATTVTPMAGASAAGRPRSGLRLGPTGWLALGVLVAAALLAALAPLLAPADPNHGDLLSPFAGPGPEHWLGTDATGRDIASRLIHGARTSLLGPAAIVVLSLLVGLPLALAAAWHGGAVAFVINRALDILFAVPGLLLAILAVALFGPGLWPAVIALAIAYLPYVARLTTTAAERERRLPYIDALSVQGQSVIKIAWVHLLRNLSPVIAGQATITFAYALIDLASLSFLGLAVQAPTADWGAMMSDRDAILQGHPGQVIAAGTLVVATVLSLFVLGSRLSGDRPSASAILRLLGRRAGARRTPPPGRVPGPVAGPAPDPAPDPALLRLRELSLDIVDDPHPPVPILRGIDLTVRGGEAVGIVGESGSGKSLTLRAIARLLPAQAQVGGQVVAGGQDVGRLQGRRLRRYRQSEIGFVFQDPRAAINPMHTVGDFLVEPARDRGEDVAAARVAAGEVLAAMGIADPERRMRQYPFELSGGLLQRVMIASVLLGRPTLLLADEPTTALDLTTQADVLALTDRLRRERGIAMLFVTHDLNLAMAVCQRIVVVYAGRILEVADAETIQHAPLHPYTRGLLLSRPPLDVRLPTIPVIPGAPVSLAESPPGCPFAARCPVRLPHCADEPPPSLVHASGRVNCHRAEEIAAGLLDDVLPLVHQPARDEEAAS